MSWAWRLSHARCVRVCAACVARSNSIRYGGRRMDGWMERKESCQVGVANSLHHQLTFLRPSRIRRDAVSLVWLMEDDAVAASARSEGTFDHAGPHFRISLALSSSQQLRVCGFDVFSSLAHA
ncbi:hypothetical protein R3P38DRAFT_1512601 [Favolaschia claudopus]|uniref:Secreted protein n=1 Tax=Favolaschia claudopus TaxID=2862362 RepID=A0AAW0AKG3_9AGAR